MTNKDIQPPPQSRLTPLEKIIDFGGRFCVMYKMHAADGQPLYGVAGWYVREDDITPKLREDLRDQAYIDLCNACRKYREREEE